MIHLFIFFEKFLKVLIKNRAKLRLIFHVIKYSGWKQEFAVNIFLVQWMNKDEEFLLFMKMTICVVLLTVLTSCTSVAGRSFSVQVQYAALLLGVK